MRGKVAIVTGASRGIGKAIALGLAREGAKVVVAARSEVAPHEKLPGTIGKTAAEIEGFGGEALPVRCDVTDEASVDAMVEATLERFGRIDVLVNNAAIDFPFPCADMPLKRWDIVLRVNTTGPFLCSKAVIPVMRKQGGGSIVNVSTNVAERGVKNLVAYASSKGGIHAMTKQLAVELAPYRIRVNTFAPGPTMVARNLEDDPDYDRTWGGAVPMGRAADPDEMIGPAIFLASEDSSYMTGQIFFVDGGWTAAGRFPEENMEKAARKHAKENG